MNDTYVPHFVVEINLKDGWHPVAWFVTEEDATLFHTWLCINFPRENYRISDV